MQEWLCTTLYGNLVVVLLLTAQGQTNERTNSWVGRPPSPTHTVPVSLQPTSAVVVPFGDGETGEGWLRLQGGGWWG